MEKHVLEHFTSYAPGGHDIVIFDLESGDEECQIKRIVWSGVAEGNFTFRFGLFQEATPVIGDFLTNNGSAVIYTTCTRNQFLINETTTVRVPRGWTLAVLTEHHAGANPEIAGFTLQLNYKVLS